MEACVVLSRSAVSTMLHTLELLLLLLLNGFSQMLVSLSHDGTCRFWDPSPCMDVVRLSLRILCVPASRVTIAFEWMREEHNPAIHHSIVNLVYCCALQLSSIACPEKKELVCLAIEYPLVAFGSQSLVRYLKAAKRM